jgi:GTPase SAR1 family protein
MRYEYTVSVTACDYLSTDRLGRIYWVAATVSRLILAKMWLKLHHPRLSKMAVNEKPELRDRVFATSIEVIEFGHLLESNENTAKWGWLFRTYMQCESTNSRSYPPPLVKRLFRRASNTICNARHEYFQSGSHLTRELKI